MVILTSVEIIAVTDSQGNHLEIEDETVINLAKDDLINYYKIDPEVLYLQDVIVHEVD
jgi:hypothetical protein